MLHLNTYVMGLYDLFKYLYSYSVEIDFGRQNLKTSKVGPRAVRQMILN